MIRMCVIASNHQFKTKMRFQQILAFVIFSVSFNQESSVALIMSILLRSLDHHQVTIYSARCDAIYSFRST